MVRRLLPLLAAIILASACADGSGTTTTAATPETTTTTAAPGGAVTTPTAEGGFPVEIHGVMIPARPDRILSGTATHTEILFAIGAGAQVVAVDLWSDHPAEVADLPRFDAFNPSVEAMAAFDPDLVILSFNPSGTAEGLTALGIPVLVLDAPDDLDGVFAQYAELGAAVGRVDEAAELSSRMREEIASIVANAPEGSRGGTYYHELDPSHFSIGSDTFIGHLYSLLGLVSIGDGAGGGFLQLTAEFILDSDPDFIFLADAGLGGESAETVAARPGWDRLTAVAAGRVFEIDESASSRWGPRIVDFVRSIAEAVLEVAP